MEESSVSPNDKPIDLSLRMKQAMPFWMPSAIVLVAGLIAIVCLFYIGQVRTSNLTKTNGSISAQVANLTQKIKAQADMNNGTVAPDKVYKDPAGGIGLLSGAITLTLPKDWVRVPQGFCTGGTIDSVIVCQDVAAVAPASLVGPDGTAKWSVPISVFNYGANDGDAKNWFYTKYQGMSVDSDITGSLNASATPINGYSAFTHEYQAFHVDWSQPEYTQAYYAVVHGKYGLVINIMVQEGSGNGTNSFDYRSTYQPLIDQMLHSIKFQD